MKISRPRLRTCLKARWHRPWRAWNVQSFQQAPDSDRKVELLHGHSLRKVDMRADYRERPD
jgi:hypothetical protein